MRYYYKYTKDDVDNIYRTVTPKVRWRRNTVTICVKCGLFPKWTGRKESIGQLTHTSSFKRIYKKDLFLYMI